MTWATYKVDFEACHMPIVAEKKTYLKNWILQSKKKNYFCWQLEIQSLLYIIECVGAIHLASANLRTMTWCFRFFVSQLRDRVETLRKSFCWALTRKVFGLFTVKCNTHWMSDYTQKILPNIVRFKKFAFYMFTCFFSDVNKHLWID